MIILCEYPLLIGIDIFIMFTLWSVIVIHARRALPRIKLFDEDLYKRILGGQSVSWVERGWTSPGDITIQFRLLKAMYQRKPKDEVLGFPGGRIKVIINFFSFSLIVLVIHFGVLAFCIAKHAPLN